MIIKYLFCSQTSRFLKFYLVFIRSMQFKKKFEQKQSFAGFEQASAGLEQASAGFEQGSANYLGSNRILRGSWPHRPPSLNWRFNPGWDILPLWHSEKKIWFWQRVDLDRYVSSKTVMELVFYNSLKIRYFNIPWRGE